MKHLILPILLISGCSTAQYVTQPVTYCEAEWSRYRAVPIHCPEVE